MKDLKKELENVEEEKKLVDEQLELLFKSEDVKKYFELTAKQHKLRNTENELFKKIKNEEYDNCNHIWINISEDNNVLNKKIYGCIKCGLDKRVWYTSSPTRLEIEQRAMYEYLRSCYYNKDGIQIDMPCEFELGKAIYKRIIETHPDIDDKTASIYLRAAIHNIKEKNKFKKRNNKLLKRLSLNQK